MSVPSATKGGELFVPYRAVGLVSAGLPVAVVQHGGETFVTASLGRTFQIYNCAKLRQVFVGPSLPAGITALGAHDDYTLVACGTAVVVYKRAELVATLEGEHTAPVRHLLAMGSSVVSVDATGLLVAWQLPSGEVAGRLHPGFAASALCHPATYLNKVLLGAPDGRMQASPDTSADTSPDTAPHRPLPRPRSRSCGTSARASGCTSSSTGGGRR